MKQFIRRSSFICPSTCNIPLDASISIGVTLESGAWSPTKVKWWSKLLKDAANFIFNGEEKFRKPKFSEGLPICVEQDVDMELSLGSTHVRDSLKQFFNYMIALQSQYGVLPSYDYYWSCGD
ncbi:16637_t:CDS:2 [Gigaspora margarita]|uniref:16637_t:CDS:1 n=1 Tax=Gigaspora margarita TaxID=4874 RepID=A0ABN7UR19_GIGMA|nr:16637_t:CDS:2 [Gigaspora margarita]